MSEPIEVVDAVTIGDYYWLHIRGHWEIGQAESIPYEENGVGFRMMGTGVTYWTVKECSKIIHIPFPRERS